MKKDYIIIRITIFFLCIAFVNGKGIGQSKVGTSAAQFLGIGVGPKAVAMGGAYVAMPNDVTSLYWNPGAIAHVEKSQFTFSNTDWFIGSKFRWAGLMLNFDGSNAFGFSITQLDHGSEEVTTVFAPEGTGEVWTAQDMAIGLSYSRKLTNRFSIGGSVKYISQSIWNESASTIALDLGLLFITGFYDMRLGMSISNFGGDMTLDGRDLLTRVDIDPTNPGSNKTLVSKLKTDAWPIPLFFRVGVAVDLLKSEMLQATIAADALRPSDNDESLSVGGEVVLLDILSIRGGYRVSFQDDSYDGLSLGAGLHYSLPNIGTIELGYAYSKFSYFGNINTLSVSYSF